MYIFNDQQRLWVDDLLTTDAPQGQGMLQSKCGSFCCLGRAMEVLGVPLAPAEDQRHPRGQQYLEDGYKYGVDLSRNARDALKLHCRSGWINRKKVAPEWLDELTDTDVTNLVGLNDTLAWPFEKIGRFIESNPEAVFQS